MKEPKLFETIYGSKLYGTNGPNSDVDYKGVFLPYASDMLLGKAPKQYTKSTGSDSKANSVDDVDETYYSLQYYLNLLSQGETGAMDMFFAATNRDAVIIETDAWKELIENADKVITKNIKKYLGFAKSQSVKYSFKGDKLLNYQTFYDELSKAIDANEKDENGIWITLNKFLMRYHFAEPGPEEDYAKHDKIIGKRSKLNHLPFGDHTYYLKMNNGENFLMISDVIFSLDETIVVSRGKVKKTMDSYGKRAESAKNAGGADYKALSHGIRVLFQAEELLTTGKITFPLKGEALHIVRDVKFGTTKMSYNEIVKYIEDKIKYIEEELLPKSTLRSSADQNWIDAFVLKQYKNAL